MRLFECPTHSEDFNHPGCPDCDRINKQIQLNKEVFERSKSIKRTHYPASLYWPKSKNGGNHGRVIENLGNKPQRFSTKTEYRNFLKRNNVSEAG